VEHPGALYIPVLYIIENNQYAQSTPIRLGVSGQILDRAKAFGIQAAEIRSNDPFELDGVFASAVKSVREGRKPFFQVVQTYRLGAHSKGDDNRDPAEIEAAKAEEPLRILAKHIPEEILAPLRGEVRAEVDSLVETALRSPMPEPGELPVDDHDETNPIEAPIHATNEPNPTYLRSLNLALHALFEGDPSVTLIGEDLLDPYGGAFKVSKGLSTRYPERVFTSPISEAAIVGVAGGMALRGRKAVAEIMFGDFVTLAADQLINHAAKYHWMYNGQVEVPLTVRTPMGGRRGYGPTHSQSLEKIFLGIPGLAVVAPSHVHDAGALLYAAVSRRFRPTLFIENKLLYPRKLMLPTQGACGPFAVKSSGRRFPTLHLSLAGFERPAAAIVTYGGSAPYALEAAEKLMIEHELVVDVIIPSLLAPIPEQDLREALGTAPLILTLEEGTLRNGWGAEVVARLAEEPSPLKARFARIGAPECPIPNSKELEARILFDAESIVERILKEI
jgi:2-oxoisovalerate dehydrogenase E1 component